jgi:glycosyltransferase involved in cell wall biosynthesis
VAHGDACQAALRAARRWRLPLATVFHDWWPDLVRLPARARAAVEAGFRELHRASAASLCVGAGMVEALGAHPGAEVLYPIPEALAAAPASGAAAMDGALRVIYLGNLRDYGAMLAEALEALQHGPARLQVRGSRPPWPEAFTRRMRETGCFLDFAPRRELDAWLATAGAFLIAMEFAPAVRRRMETSFPSKLTECAQFGRPLVIWGPEWCSAVRWGREAGALCVTDRRPAALAEAVRRLAGDAALRDRQAAVARQAAAGCFSPAGLQEQFVQALRRAAGRAA